MAGAATAPRRRSGASGAGGVQRLGDDRERLVDLVGRRHERRDDPDHVDVRARGQDEQVRVEARRLDRAS